MAFPSWYLLSVKKGHEQTLSRSLEKGGWETWCPVHVPHEGAHPKNKKAFAPVFPGLLFIKENKGAKLPRKTFPSRVNVLHWFAQPVVVPGQTVEMVRNFLAGHERVVVETVAVAPNSLPQQLTGLTNSPEMPCKDGLILPFLGLSLTGVAVRNNLRVVYTDKPEALLLAKSANAGLAL